LLEVFRDLEVHGADKSKLGAFVNELNKALPPGWTRDKETERAVNRYSGSPEPQFAFRIAPIHGRPAAVLFLMRRDRALKVTNIVPDVGELTRQQYNALVEAFDAICEPIAKRHGLRVHMIP
jgi:hypothetical protein